MSIKFDSFIPTSSQATIFRLLTSRREVSFLTVSFYAIGVTILLGDNGLFRINDLTTWKRWEYCSKSGFCHFQADLDQDTICIVIGLQYCIVPQECRQVPSIHLTILLIFCSILCLSEPGCLLDTRPACLLRLPWDKGAVRTNLFRLLICFICSITVFVVSTLVGKPTSTASCARPASERCCTCERSDNVIILPCAVILSVSLVLCGTQFAAASGNDHCVPLDGWWLHLISQVESRGD